MNPFFTPKWVTIYVIVLITIGTFVDRPYEGTMLLASLMICTWLAISLHEHGHFLFGKWCGYDFIFLAFGPVLIEKESAGIRIKENRNWLFFGGVAMMTPPQEKREILVKKMALYTAGGPFISLLLALFGLGLYELFSYQMLFYFALMNGAILMATLLPLKGSMKTDGYVLFTLMKNNDQSRLLTEDLLVSKELLSSKHPSQYTCEYIQLAKEKPPTVDNLQYAMLIYYHEIEKNDLLAAVNAMNEYLRFQ